MIARYLLTLAVLSVALLIHGGASTPLDWADKLALLTWRLPVAFEEVRFYYAAMPRTVLALLVGASLGLAGSVLQQIMRNRLVSPFTLGISSGAWLALLCASVLVPGLAARYGEWFALAGAAASLALVLLIAGRGGLGGLPVVLAGMAINILFGAIVIAVLILNQQQVQHLFIWGAGDLAQTDWSKVQWLAPRLAVALPVVALCVRPLTLMRLGQEGAAARGLAVWPFVPVLLLVSLWLAGNVVAAIGVIGFIGLLGPNMARYAGARTTGDELLMSAVLGAALLVITDAIALYAGHWTTDLVPTGASAALIGAPALIWLTASRVRALDHTSVTTPAMIDGTGPLGVCLLLVAAIALTFLSATFNPTLTGWILAWPNELVWSLRWPRILMAAAAGAGVAVAGVILQRLIRNPLASPDILGMTAGATLALVLTAVLAGGSIYEVGPAVAFAGSAVVLVFLLLFGRRTQFAPGTMALVGISLAALLDSLVQFVLAGGGDAAVAVLGWMAGSTYRAKPFEAFALSASIGVAIAVACAGRRWLTLIHIGDAIAAGRGLSVPVVRGLLLVLAALITAVVTALMGPIAFVGLLAPHIAVMLGARTVTPQILGAALAGTAIMVASDWLGRSILYPLQMPAGTVAAILGGGYLILLLTRRRMV